MTDERGTARASGTRSAPGIVAPTNRVNVALPFSKFVMEEPSREFAELAAIVAELAAAVESAVASPHTALLRQRAEALAARVH